MSNIFKNMPDMTTQTLKTPPAFTYIWAIENCPVFLVPEDIESPVFKVECLDNAEWFLVINYTEPRNLSFSIYRGNDSGPERVEIVFELGFLSKDGLYIKSENQLGVFEKGGHFEFSESLDCIFRFKRDQYITNDTLTLRCQMWRLGSDTPRPNMCFAGTRLGLERRTFFWHIRNFSTLRLGQDVKYHVIPTIAEKPPLTIVLCVMEDNGTENILIKFLEHSKTTFFRFNCEMSVIDAIGKKCIFRRSFNLSTSSEKFMYFFEKREVTNRASLIPNDVLCIRCEFEIGYGAIWSDIEYYLHPLSSGPVTDVLESD